MGTICITLNDKHYEVAQNTCVADFVASLALPTKGIALAINYEVIPKEQWSAVQLANGNELMLIHAVSGG
ncbi:MAG: sulfur carrier protein ThiS [Bacteroidales bacterium]|jgi:sulfur carrier protein|nr:sulfur carrier protein ThiS [Bacteroidales bacterium]